MALIFKLNNSKKSYMHFLSLLFLLSVPLWAETLTKRIAIISDFNNSYGSTQYGADVKKAIGRLGDIRPDLILSTGDMVAGQKAGLDYQAMWNAFHDTVTLPIRNFGIPFAVTVGNHDGSGYPKFKNERNIFIDEWMKLKPELNFSDDSNYPSFYSFVLDDIFIASIDSTLVGPLSIDQLNFLDLELKKHADKKYKIIFTHVPMFQFNQSNPNESFFDVILYELLKKHGVQFYFTGHHHAYYPGYYGGIHFISQACLGAGQEKLIGMETVSPRAITIIDFLEDSFQIYALSGSNFEEKINHQTLPQKIFAKGKELILKDR